MKYTRKPEHDKRIGRGDDFAGDAWLNNETNKIEYGAVGQDRNKLNSRLIAEEGRNNKDETHWKLYVPDEHCVPGLEVGIVATEQGLRIGGELLTWSDIETAKMYVA